jgi:hypothetical protein
MAGIRAGKVALIRFFAESPFALFKKDIPSRQVWPSVGRVSVSSRTPCRGGGVILDRFFSKVTPFIMISA